MKTSRSYGDADARADRVLAFQLLHQLRNAVNQDVLVVDRRDALDARNDLQPVAVMLVFPNRGFRFFRKGAKRVLHLRNQILEHRIGHVADKEIALAVFGREKLLIRIRGFSSQFSS